jgi:hypothetical protein
VNDIAPDPETDRVHGTTEINVRRGEVYVLRAAHADGRQHALDGLKRSAVGVPPFAKGEWLRGWDEGRIEWNWARVHERSVAQLHVGD